MPRDGPIILSDLIGKLDVLSAAKNETLGYGPQTDKAIGRVHEAGHAVVAWWLGIPIVSVSVGLTVGLVWNNARSKQVVEPSRGLIRFRASMKIKPRLPVMKRHRFYAQICMFVLGWLPPRISTAENELKHGPGCRGDGNCAAALKTERGDFNL